MIIKVNVPDRMLGEWEVKSVGEEKYLYRHQNDASKLIAKTDEPISEDSIKFIQQAYGDVFVAGLGLGQMVKALIEKNEVETITIIEKDVELIELVGKYLESVSLKVKCIHAEALTYVDRSFYDFIWFDIWEEVKAENCKQIERLKSHYWKKAEEIFFNNEERCRHLLLLK
ncbi:hypothetical protein [Chitinophaga defluvii]|uniref:Spermine/spermidine synthase n=1 Tax=Chitinophaga defluvii TaxID=3163343 RepID=A0ABV2TEX6_9BACT